MIATNRAVVDVQKMSDGKLLITTYQGSDEVQLLLTRQQVYDFIQNIYTELER